MSESRVVGHKRACTHVQLNTEWAVGQLLMFEFYVKTTLGNIVYIYPATLPKHGAPMGVPYFFFGTELVYMAISDTAN